MRLFLEPNGFTGRQVEQTVRCFRRLESCGNVCSVSRGDSLNLLETRAGQSWERKSAI